MDKKENLVNLACEELGVNKGGLASLLKIHPMSLTKWNIREIPEDKKEMIRLLIENKKLKDENIVLKNLITKNM